MFLGTCSVDDKVKLKVETLRESKNSSLFCKAYECSI